MARALAQTRRNSEAEARSPPATGETEQATATVGVPAYLQHKCARCGSGASPPDEKESLQHQGATATSGPGIHSVAAQGVANASAPLPGAQRIQAAFGRHDISDARAQVGGPAEHASQRMGAHAYTLGSRIGFKSQPDVRLAAHEAAHVVQQRRGVHLKDGVGRPGDRYETQADAVAERVVAGQSAEDLLDENSSEGAASGVQAKCDCGTCASCRDKEDEPGAVQMDLDVNATRLFEGEVVAAAAAEGGEASASGRETDAGTGKGEETEGASSAENAPDAKAADANSSGGDGSGGVSTPDAAPASPSLTPAAPAAPEGGDTTTRSSEGGECAGTGAAACYHEPSEEPEEEPDEQPPNPEATKTEEETSAGDEEDAPEIDDCSAQTAEAGIPAATDAAPAPATGSDAAPAAADASTPADNAGAEPAKPAATATSGGGGGGEAAPASAPSPMDAVLAQAEAQRGGAVTQYGDSQLALAGAAGGTAALRRGTSFAPTADETAADAIRRSDAAMRADRFFADAADRLDAAIAFAQQTVPDQLGAQAEASKSQLAASIEFQKGAISSRIDVARAQAREDAGIARSEVEAQAASFMGEAAEQTAGAIDALTTAHGEDMGQVDDLETTTLDSVNQTYAQGRTALEGLGTTIGGECTARGEEYATIYNGFAHCTENGFWDGDLSERRAEAQANAARSVASGFHDRIVESARKRAREVMRDGRKKDRCAIIASAATSRTTLDEQLGALTTTLQTSLDTAIAQAERARDGIISSINASLAATLSQLDRQEREQRQAANDAGYMQQVIQEQMAHSAAASVQRIVADAANATQSGLALVQARFAAANPPDPEVLDQILKQVAPQIGGTLDGLMGSVEGGLALATEQLAAAGQAGLGALDAITEGNDQQAGAVSDGFTAAMSQIAGTDNFASQRAGFAQQTEQASAAGTAALAQVVTGMQNGCEGVLAAAAKTLEEAGTGLEKNLRQSQQGLDCEIPRRADEAASHEAPAWKRLVAVLLVILVIVIVIAVIVATGGAAMAALVAAAGPIGAGIIVGAAVGAVTSGLLTVAGNLWSNQSWSKGLGKAILIGALTGAAGGGFGAAAGVAFKGASFAVQLGAQMVVAGGVDVAAQFISGGFSFEHFSLKNLGLTLLITAVTFGIGHRLAARGGAPVTENAPPPGSTTETATPVTGETATTTAPATDAPSVSPTSTPETPNVTPPAADTPTVAAPDAPEIKAPSTEPPPAAPADEGVIAAPEDAPEIKAPQDEPTTTAGKDDGSTTGAPEDAPDVGAPKEETPVPTTDDPLAPKDPSEMPEPVADDTPEQKPWEQGKNPRRYRNYKNNLRRRAPTKEALEPDQWWEKYGRKPGNNPHGGKGAPDHQAVVRDLEVEARRQFPDRERYQLLSDVPAPGRSGVGSKPDVAVVDTRTGKVVKVFEAARFDESGALIRGDETAKIAAYEADGLPYEFHPVGPNKPPGGVLRSPGKPPVSTPPNSTPPSTPTQ